MNRFRFTRVRDVEIPKRSNPNDAGLDFYVPRDLVLQDLVNANKEAIGMESTPLSVTEGKYGYTMNNHHITHIHLGPHSRILIPSGIMGLLEPKPSMLMAANKSGISTKNGLIFTAEIVDSPYTGEIHLGVYNTTNQVITIEAGKKLIQFIHVPIFTTEPEEIPSAEYHYLAETWGTRGDKGFGSTQND